MTVFDIRQGVRDFFGWLLCLCGIHKPESTWWDIGADRRQQQRQCLRCDAVEIRNRPADREGEER